MSNAIKLNDNYIDSSAITHNRTQLDTILNNARVKKLWDGRLTTNGTTANLNDSIQNYDFILVIGCGDSGAKARPTSVLLSNSAISAANPSHVTLMVPYIGSNPVTLHFGFPTDTTLRTVSGFTNYFVLTELWGIKIL